MAKVGKTSEKSVRISKGIILIFVTFYLIFYGVFMSTFVTQFQQSNPGAIPLYVSFLPFVFFIAAIFAGFRFLVFLKTSNEYKSRQKVSRRKGKTSIYKQALFLLILIIVFIPLLSPIIDQGKNKQNFSVYNSEWNGCSDFKYYIEQEGYETGCVQSSLSATDRLDKKILLVLLGPNSFYNPIYEIPYFITFFNTSNSIFICHDHGSTETLLWEIFLASMFNPDLRDKIPITVFPSGILRDNESYDTNPKFPIIKTWTSHPITSGISEVILSKSSLALGGPFVEFSGWNVIGYSSFYSFLDKNDDGKYIYEDDGADIGMISDAIADSDSPFSGMNKIPTGGFPQAIFMAKETQHASGQSSRIFVSADASLFNNELINDGDYDNRRFGINIIDWLTFGDKDDWIVVFDEAHIRPENSRDLSSAGIYGYILQYIVHLSTNPITAWIYPLLAIYTLKKYIPSKKKQEKIEKKKREKEEKREVREKFRTSSFFAKKIEWYRDKRKYGKALTLLYRRLERKLNAQLGAGNITTQNVINFVKRKEGRINRAKERRLIKFMDKMLAIKNGKTKIKNHVDFENFFYEMEWAANNI